MFPLSHSSFSTEQPFVPEIKLLEHNTHTHTQTHHIQKISWNPKLDLNVLGYHHFLLVLHDLNFELCIMLYLLVNPL